MYFRSPRADSAQCEHLIESAIGSRLGAAAMADSDDDLPHDTLSSIGEADFTLSSIGDANVTVSSLGEANLSLSRNADAADDQAWHGERQNAHGSHVADEDVASAAEWASPSASASASGSEAHPAQLQVAHYLDALLSTVGSAAHVSGAHRTARQQSKSHIAVERMGHDWTVPAGAVDTDSASESGPDDSADIALEAHVTTDDDADYIDYAVNKSEHNSKDLRLGANAGHPTPLFQHDVAATGFSTPVRSQPGEVHSQEGGATPLSARSGLGSTTPHSIEETEWAMSTWGSLPDGGLSLGYGGHPALCPPDSYSSDDASWSPTDIGLGSSASRLAPSTTASAPLTTIAGSPATARAVDNRHLGDAGQQRSTGAEEAAHVQASLSPDRIPQRRPREDKAVGPASVDRSTGLHAGGGGERAVHSRSPQRSMSDRSQQTSRQESHAIQTSTSAVRDAMHGHATSRDRATPHQSSASRGRSQGDTSASQSATWTQPQAQPSRPRSAMSVTWSQHLRDKSPASSRSERHRSHHSAILSESSASQGHSAWASLEQPLASYPSSPLPFHAPSVGASSEFGDRVGSRVDEYAFVLRREIKEREDERARFAAREAQLNDELSVLRLRLTDAESRAAQTAGSEQATAHATSSLRAANDALAQRLAASEAEVRRLQTYIGRDRPGQVLRGSAARESERAELDALRARLARTQESERLLGVRVSALEEIARVSENAASKVLASAPGGGSALPPDAASELLTKWRKRVYELLVGRRLDDLARQSEVAQLRRELDGLRRALEQEGARTRLANSVAGDCRAQLSMAEAAVHAADARGVALAANLKDVENELSVARDERARVRESLAAGTHALRTMYESACAAVRRADVQSQRLSFAADRLGVASDLVARKLRPPPPRFDQGTMTGEGGPSADAWESACPDDAPLVGLLRGELGRLSVERTELVRQLQTQADAQQAALDAATAPLRLAVAALTERASRLDAAVEDARAETQAARDQHTADIVRLNSDRESLLASAVRAERDLWAPRMEAAAAEADDLRRQLARATASLSQLERHVARQRTKHDSADTAHAEVLRSKLDEAERSLRSLWAERNALLLAVREYQRLASSGPAVRRGSRPLTAILRGDANSGGFVAMGQKGDERPDDIQARLRTLAAAASQLLADDDGFDDGTDDGHPRGE